MKVQRFLASIGPRRQKAIAQGRVVSNLTYEARARGLIATLLLSTVRVMSNGATRAADSPSGTAGIATVSRIGRTIGQDAARKPPVQVEFANLPSVRLTEGSINAGRDATSRKPAEAGRPARDLRSPVQEDTSA